jgi:hypothetical protein
VWYDDLPPGQDPPPTSCREAERIASRDRYVRVIYGGDPNGRAHGTPLAVDFVDQAALEELLDRVGAHDIDGFIARGCLRQGQGALRALRDECERGLPLDQCRGGAVREHEAGQMKRAILAPRLFTQIECPSAHYDRAGRPRGKHPRGRLDVRRIRGGEHPLVQPLAADAHRLFDADIWSRDETDRLVLFRSFRIRPLRCRKNRGYFARVSTAHSVTVTLSRGPRL